MTEQELSKARDLLEELEKCELSVFYFEIPGEEAGLLARYIRELEKRVLKYK